MTYEKYKARETVKSYSLAKLKVRARENIELLIINSGPRLAKQGRRWVYYKIVILVAPITNLYYLKQFFFFYYLMDAMQILLAPSVRVRL